MTSYILKRSGTDMGCNEHIVVLDQYFVLRHWFLPHYICQITGNKFVVESKYKSVLINNIGTCYVYK